MEDDNNFLGIGWKFPPSFNHHSSRVEMVNGLSDIRESLIILMRTRVGERIVEQQYGCDLTPLAFQQLDLNLETFMVNNIKQTITEHEPRVEVLDVQLTTPNDGEGAIGINISYKVKKLDIEETIQYGYHPIFNK
ncbi:MAG: GPW/gp25 family protein [Candidatus Cardinium sp.]|uniref:GPW/gp25 family protein n=1 Tax=Candidatus Cardinium sp. TP TaxID=2961955 RepID=UPI0021AFB071|nr:GPW/gp25 family protein [Candidatus Cardinium sp. TP]MCT4697166.1 GPW/gp25 family protein [Candidatus Cardinium sp. TP]MDN5247159.1 GPW/gp25 family protein [Candidatus Cardinium sp.]